MIIQNSTALSQPLFFISSLLIISLLTLSQLCQAGENNDDVDQIITVTLENDLFTFDDGGYTNGLAYGWGYGRFDSFENRTPGWIEWLTEDWYIATQADKQRAISYGITQQIYTPDKTSSKEPNPDDRPYAGLLWWQTSWFAFDEIIADKITLELGVVGPASLAEQTQELAHNITGASTSEGWDDQLENEVIFRLAAQRNWRLQSSNVKRVEFDMISHFYGGVGNRRSDIGTGISLRIGSGLADSLAIASMTPGRDINPLAGRPSHWYAFMSLGGRYVFNDITLDGNTFKDGPSVDLEHWQALASLGAAWNSGNWGWLFSMHRGGDEWQTQQEDTMFGSLSVSYRFKAKSCKP